MSAVVAAALGTWLGIHAVRMCLAMIVWNVAEDSTALAGGLGVTIWTVGIVAAFAVQRIPRVETARWLGALFAVLTVLRQALPGETSSPAFAFAAWIVWLAWLPAFVDLLARSRHLAAAAPGVVLGVGLQLAGQTALHGLDLHLLAGPGASLASALLAGTFVVAIWRLRPIDTRTGGAWGACALGPYLFVELTLLANPGRLETISGLDRWIVALSAGLGFVAALASLAVPLDRRARLVLGALGAVALAPGRALGPFVPVASVVAQIGLAQALAAAFDRGLGRADRRVRSLAAAGQVGFFVLLFAFYSFRDAVDPIWAFGAALVVLTGAARGSVLVVHPRRAALAAAGAFVAALAIAAVPSAGTRAVAPRQGDLRILTYNVHQGFDFWSLPSGVALADTIATADADLVALQEVNRGWNVSGGADVLAFLRWRLPEYHVVFGPMDTALMGNAILSRFPVSESGRAALPRGKSALPRGYVWARVETPRGALLFASAHFTAYEGFDADRTAQAEAIVAFWGGRQPAILAGDYNSHPEDPAVARLVGAGLVDAAAARGLGQTPTYASGDPHERIDYVFLSRDLEPVSAALPHSLASDHSPVLVVVRPR